MAALPTLSIDFDGVVNPYSQGWQGGEIYDSAPNPGTRQYLEFLAQYYRLVITTGRTDLAPVRQALEDWGLSQFFADVSNMKPPAVAYIDDNGITFKNWEQAVGDLKRKDTGTFGPGDLKSTSPEPGVQ